jgi:hypothetical protein
MSNHKPLSTAQAKLYVQNWHAVGEILESESAAYLRTMSDDENRRVIKRIFSHTHPYEYRTSGLLEQQQWFAKLIK